MGAESFRSDGKVGLVFGGGFFLGLDVVVHESGEVDAGAIESVHLGESQGLRGRGGSKDGRGDHRRWGSRRH